MVEGEGLEAPYGSICNRGSGSGLSVYCADFQVLVGLAYNSIALFKYVC